MKWLTLVGIARRVGVSTATVRREIARGELEAVRVGRRGLRVAEPALQRYLEGRKVRAA